MKVIPITQEGPVWTTLNGEVDQPILTCRGCKHLGVHDWHYFYCGAQDAQNQRAAAYGKLSYAYPWPGAGVHMYAGPRPEDTNCPFPPQEEKKEEQNDDC